MYIHTLHTSLDTQLCLKFSLKSQSAQLRIFKPVQWFYRVPNHNLRQIGPASSCIIITALFPFF